MLFLLNRKEVIGYIDIEWYRDVLDYHITLEEDSIERDHLYEMEEYCKKFTQLGRVMSDLWYNTKNYDEKVEAFISKQKIEFNKSIVLIFDDDTIGFLRKDKFIKILCNYNDSYGYRIMKILNNGELLVSGDKYHRSSSKKKLNLHVYMEKQY